MAYFKEKTVLIRNMEPADARCLFKHLFLTEKCKGDSIHEAVSSVRCKSEKERDSMPIHHQFPVRPSVTDRRDFGRCGLHRGIILFSCCRILFSMEKKRRVGSIGLVCWNGVLSWRFNCYTAANFLFGI